MLLFVGFYYNDISTKKKAFWKYGFIWSAKLVYA